MDFILDDIETYADTLVSIAKELITPWNYGTLKNCSSFLILILNIQKLMVM
jgi:hypothetical protein